MRTNETAVHPRSGPRPERGARGGFTLLEMILVISTILFLLGVLVVMASQAHVDAQRQATRSLVGSIESALSDYYRINGTFPPRGGNNTENRRNLYDHLTGDQYGKCVSSIPESIIQREPSWAANPDEPYFADPWGNQIYYLPFDEDGLLPNPPASKREEVRKWGMNGGVPLVWSVGPDGMGWTFASIRGVGSAQQLQDYLYLKRDRDVNADNIHNFRDIPLQYTQ